MSIKIVERAHAWATANCAHRLDAITHDDLVEAYLAGFLDEDKCEHDGYVIRGQCERCLASGLESDAEIYEREAPR